MRGRVREERGEREARERREGGERKGAEGATHVVADSAAQVDAHEVSVLTHLGSDGEGGVVHSERMW